MVEWQDIRGDCQDQDQRSGQVDNNLHRMQPKSYLQEYELLVQ
jgi:hypothetical protein